MKKYYLNIIFLSIMCMFSLGAWAQTEPADNEIWIQFTPDCMSVLETYDEDGWKNCAGSLDCSLTGIPQQYEDYYVFRYEEPITDIENLGGELKSYFYCDVVKIYLPIGLMTLSEEFQGNFAGSEICKKLSVDRNWVINIRRLYRTYFH
ncbi:MAG: hypothetical protein Q4A15_06315 [Prevotellaceae bacterium]|nr:hypothetical protein [Prevotellaceae bacterium]